MHQYDIAPEYPDKYFYIKYWLEDSKGRKEVEFWTDDYEEYQEKLKFIRLHHNYDTIKYRYPKRRG